MAPSLEAPDPADDVIANPLKAKPQLVAPEPEHCPGPESDQAGQADSCAGCPVGPPRRLRDRRPRPLTANGAHRACRTSRYAPRRPRARTPTSR